MRMIFLVSLFLLSGLTSVRLGATADGPRSRVETRLDRLEAQMRRLGAEVDALKGRQSGDAATLAGTGSEDAEYNAAYRAWADKQYANAETQLKAFIRHYPAGHRTSYARNLLGRAYLDQNKPGLAARTFYDNYKDMPKGGRAIDSLYFLGQALMKLEKPADACRAYRQAIVASGSEVPERLKPLLASAQHKAGCPV